MDYDVDDNPRLSGDLVRFGTIAEVDLQAARATVKISDDLVTGPLPWLAGRSGKTRKWSPPSVGEQVSLLCSEGDVQGGLILAGVPSDSFPAPTDQDVELIDFEDGARISYDPAAHQLLATLPDGGKARLVCPGGLFIDGSVTITGDVQVDGEITATGDVTGAGVSLDQHVHGLVKAGADKSGKPE